MERILLVEDNKSLAKLVAMKITANLPFEVDVAYSMKEAMLFTRKFDYFMALLDINLPDAPDGEIVDAVIEQDVPAMVLSGNMDKEFRRSILKKEIIDYIGKGGIEDINYIISTIDRLHKNRQHKVLIVDDSMLFRKSMQKMVKNLFFQVYAVAHGEEALGILKENPDIRIVLTDYAMPVMDGLELTREIRKVHPKNELSILAISSSKDEDISAMFLKSGATDFIKKPFSKEEFSCRLNNAIEALENIDAITNHAKRDFLTGLYNRRYFFRTMEEYFAKAVEEGENFAIAMVDIDHFKNINDTYGHDVGDQVIIHLSELLRSNTSESDMVARFGGEEFCIALKDLTNDQAVDLFENIRQKVAATPLTLSEQEEIGYTISIGVSLDHEDTLEESVNSADMMLYHAKNNGRNRVESSQ
ncbi:MAG: diguanylate cyclase [Campylobacterota bacterium]|nr:diguanylate cyclase [Campylobacterota bacterium]